MKVTLEKVSAQQIKRIAKADDMAEFIWQLVHNGWRDFKHTDYEWEKSWDKINELLCQYEINANDLWQ
jgi:hypothetical protein